MWYVCSSVHELPGRAGPGSGLRRPSPISEPEKRKSSVSHTEENNYYKGKTKQEKDTTF